MRLVSFNVEHGLPRGAEDRSDTDLLVEAVVALEPDVIAFQEIDRRSAISGPVDQAAAVAAALGGASVFASRARRGDTGVALVARGPIDEVEIRRFVSRDRTKGGRPNPLRRASWRTTIFGRVTVDGRSLQVCSAHLELVSRTNIVQLERVVATMAARPGPAVLMGDLNRPTRLVAPVTAAVGLELLADDEPTHPASAPVRRIDHVATRGARVVAHRVAELAVSDHRALVVDVEL